MITERIDARDVLDPNAKTAKGFSARVVGRFVRSGPNAWDDYMFAPDAGGDAETIEVMAGVPIQVEGNDARFRMRCHGDVLRLKWLHANAGDPIVADCQARFVAECTRPWSEDAGRGAAAVIAEKLASTAPKPSLD